MDLLSAQELLGVLDEYSLYCHYLEFEPIIGAKYQSRLRTGDDRASFGLYTRTKGGGELPHEFMWKDQGLPCSPNYGDVFDLVKQIYGYETRWEAMARVAQDFNLMEGSDNVPKQLIITPVRKEPCRIRIKSKPFDSVDLAYWAKYGITPEILSLFNVTRVDYFFLFDSDKTARSPRGRMYAYRIHNRYQLYQPKPKEFYMDWTELHIPGFAQLRKKNKLIITKSYKDVMLLYALGYDAIAPRAENNIPNPELISWIERTYDKAFVLFDNDGKSSFHLYPFPAVFMPPETKDPTDHCAMYGVEATSNYLKHLFND